MISFIMLYSSADYNISKEKFVYYKSSITKSHAEKVYESVLFDGTVNLDLLSIAWVESRFKKNIKRGDSGRACGQFQMHARFSYPLFVRKSWVNWSEKAFKKEIEKECRNLESLKYGAYQTKKMVDILKSKNLPLCNYNSGIKGKCSKKYEKSILSIKHKLEKAKYVCSVYTSSVH